MEVFDKVSINMHDHYTGIYNITRKLFVYIDTMRQGMNANFTTTFKTMVASRSTGCHDNIYNNSCHDYRWFQSHDTVHIHTYNSEGNFPSLCTVHHQLNVSNLFLCRVLFHHVSDALLRYIHHIHFCHVIKVQICLRC